MAMYGGYGGMDPTDPNNPYNPAQPRPGQQMLAADPMAGMGAGPSAAPQGGAISPALVAALMKQQGAGMTNKLQHQRKMADAMREGAAGQLQGTRYGNGGYLAPNVGNLASSVLGSWLAGKTDKMAQGSAEGLDAATQGQNEEWYRRMAQGYRGA